MKDEIDLNPFRNECHYVDNKIIQFDALRSHTLRRQTAENVTWRIPKQPNTGKKKKIKEGEWGRGDHARSFFFCIRHTTATQCISPRRSRLSICSSISITRFPFRTKSSSDRIRETRPRASTHARRTRASRCWIHWNTKKREKVGEKERHAKKGKAMSVVYQSCSPMNIPLSPARKNREISSFSFHTKRLQQTCTRIRSKAGNRDWVNPRDSILSCGWL